MAIAGGACSAYSVRYDVDAKWLHVRSTTCLRSECTQIDDATEAKKEMGRVAPPRWWLPFSPAE
jgi:hypothetical protein